MTSMPTVLDARSATDHFPGIGRYVINLARAMVPCSIIMTCCNYSTCLPILSLSTACAVLSKSLPMSTVKQ